MEFSKMIVLVAILIFGVVLIIDTLGFGNANMNTAKWFLTLVISSYQIKSGIENKAKIEYGRNQTK